MENGCGVNCPSPFVSPKNGQKGGDLNGITLINWLNQEVSAKRSKMSI